MSGVRDGRRIGAASVLQVLVQFTGIALALWPFAPVSAWPGLALLPGVAGVALGAWTIAHNRIGNFSVFPEPLRRARLVTTGPYAHVRHPMYGALILVTAAAAAWHGHPLNGVGAVLVVASVVAKARREERFLRARFAQYDAYRRRTRFFIPYLL